MNIPKIIEAALIASFKQYKIGAKTVIRGWHNLKADEKWNAGNDRVFPCIDTRAWIKPDPSIACGELCEIQNIILTKLHDDQDHLVITDIEAEVKACLDKLYREYRQNTENGLYAQFKSAIENGCILDEETQEKPVSVSGIQFGEPLPPDDDGEGRNYVGLTLIVSYSRSDFN